MRTDCKRDNRAVILPRASMLAMGKVTAKRGDWLRYEDSSGQHYSGRVLGRVIADRKIYIELVALMGGADSPCIRWIEPHEARECVVSPPRRIWEFMASDWRDASNARTRGHDSIISRVEHGFLSDSYLDTYGKS